VHLKSSPTTSGGISLSDLRSSPAVKPTVFHLDPKRLGKIEMFKVEEADMIKEVGVYSPFSIWGYGRLPQNSVFNLAARCCSFLPDRCIEEQFFTAVYY